MKILEQSFFQRPALTVAQELLGKYLVRKMDGAEIAFKITEVEAYVGEHDLACHASKGRTKRTEVMFGEGGHFYVYLCYGIHYLVNIVTGEEGSASAVLIRGVEGFAGPGKVTKALGIDQSFYGKRAVPESGLWFEDRPRVAKDASGKGEEIGMRAVRRTARVGVSYAGPIWSKKKYRFILHSQNPK